MQILSGEMWSGACSAKAVGAANATLPANAKPCNFHRDIGISCLRAAWRIAKPLRIFERAADNLTNADFRGDIVPRSCYAYALIPLMLEAAQRMARGLRHGECWVDCVAARAIYDNIKRDEKRFGELKEALAVANFGPGHLSRIRGEDIPGQVPKTYRPMWRQNVANFAKACGVTPEKLLLGGTGLELPHEPAAPATSEGTKGGIPQGPLARLDVNAPELPNLAGFDESRAAPGLSFDPTAAPDLPLKRSMAPPVGEENQLVPPSNASFIGMERSGPPPFVEATGTTRFSLAGTFRFIAGLLARSVSIGSMALVIIVLIAYFAFWPADWSFNHCRLQADDADRAFAVNKSDVSRAEALIKCKNPFGYTLLGSERFFRRDYQAAAHFFSLAVQSLPKDVTKETKQDYLDNLANAKLENGETLDAINILDSLRQGSYLPEEVNWDLARAHLYAAPVDGSTHYDMALTLLDRIGVDFSGMTEPGKVGILRAAASVGKAQSYDPQSKAEKLAEASVYLCKGIHRSETFWRDVLSERRQYPNASFREEIRLLNEIGGGNIHCPPAANSWSPVESDRR
jgi:hypothetical protein